MHLRNGEIKERKGVISPLRYRDFGIRGECDPCVVFHVKQPVHIRPLPTANGTSRAEPRFCPASVESGQHNPHPYPQPYPPPSWLRVGTAWRQRNVDFLIHRLLFESPSPPSLGYDVRKHCGGPRAKGRHAHTTRADTAQVTQREHQHYAKQSGMASTAVCTATHRMLSGPPG